MAKKTGSAAGQQDTSDAPDEKLPGPSRTRRGAHALCPDLPAPGRHL